MKRAFTLVELLVVVAIIVVLLALMMPALDKAIEQSLRAQCGAQQHGLLSILHAYSVDRGRRKFPSGLAENGTDATAFVPFDFVKIVEASAGNNKSARATSITHWGGTLTTGVVPKMLVDPSYRDFGYHSSTIGYVIGYQYLGGRPYLTRANNGAAWTAWKSPTALAQTGDGELVTCHNQWAADDKWSWVAHSVEGGPLGEDAPTGAGYHYTGPGAGEDVKPLSAGENIGRVDGSVLWTPMDRTHVRTTFADSNGTGSLMRQGRW